MRYAPGDHMERRLLLRAYTLVTGVSIPSPTVPYPDFLFGAGVVLC
jgi:hypothetical protein